MVYYRVSVIIPRAYAEVVHDAMRSISKVASRMFFVKGVFMEHNTGSLVEGEQVACVCAKKDLKEVLLAIVDAHPEAESVIEVIELSSWPPFTE